MLKLTASHQNDVASFSTWTSRGYQDKLVLFVYFTHSHIHKKKTVREHWTNWQKEPANSEHSQEHSKNNLKKYGPYLPQPSLGEKTQKKVAEGGASKLQLTSK